MNLAMILRFKCGVIISRKAINSRHFITSAVLLNSEPLIPSYPIKQNESLSLKKARLLYQSRKRGMLENDLILSTFAGRYLNSFNEAQLHLYDHLINKPSNDWDIYYWATGNKETPPEFQNEIMDLLKKHVKNENKECRLRQPDLNTDIA